MIFQQGGSASAFSYCIVGRTSQIGSFHQSDLAEATLSLGHLISPTFLTPLAFLFGVYEGCFVYSATAYHICRMCWKYVNCCGCILYPLHLKNGPGVLQWLRHCATSRRVPGSIPGHWGFFPGHQAVPCALGSTRPLKISTRIFLGVKTAGCVRVTTLPPSCAECLEILEP